MIRCTHGFPYAQKITKFIKDGHPIPLSIVHRHWVKLDLIKGKVNEVSFDLTIEVEWETIWARFAASDEADKLSLKRKLRELGDPSTMFLIPPHEKGNIMGCPASKVNTLTRRDLSFLKIIESAYESASPATKNSIKMTKRKICPFLNAIESCDILIVFQ